MFLMKRESCLESGSGLTLSIPELYSIVAAQSQINPQKDHKIEDCDEAVMKELQELVPKLCGSKELSEDHGKSKPRVGMRPRTEK